jgi:uncharacterized membrane protein
MADRWSFRASGRRGRWLLVGGAAAAIGVLVVAMLVIPSAHWPLPGAHRS